MRTFPRLVVLLCGLTLLAMTAGFVWRQAWALDDPPAPRLRLGCDCLAHGLVTGATNPAQSVPLVGRSE